VLCSNYFALNKAARVLSALGDALVPERHRGGGGIPASIANRTSTVQHMRYSSSHTGDIIPESQPSYRKF